MSIFNYFKRLIPIFIFLLFLFPHVAYAHAFGSQYTLPISFSLYMYGSAAALIVSFIVIGYFFKQTKKNATPQKKDITNTHFSKIITNHWYIFLLQGISLFFFLLTVATGLIGINNFEFNFNMTFFWVIFLLGTTYLSAILGNIYTVLNPWRTILQLIAFIWNGKIKGFLAYPQSLSIYPALILYILFIWVELFGDLTPYSLSIVIIIYSIVILGGSFIFGMETWMKRADIFTVCFGLLSKMGIFEVRNKKVYLRAPFSGLLHSPDESFSYLIFILFMLSSTAFDGFRETIIWGNFSSSLYIAATPLFGINAITVVDSLFLFLSPFIFLSIYLFIISIMKIIIHSSTSPLKLAYMFSYSLLPIALAYNISHYYTLFAIQGQEIFRLISDPFGFNWNIFSTSNFVINYKLLSNNFIWRTEVAFLLGGHIIAVYIAHLIALRIFPSHKKAIISQFPMLVLMVIYTVLGLWILSQPLSVGT